MLVKLSTLKKGDFFTLKEYAYNEADAQKADAEGRDYQQVPERAVWVKGDYERSEKAYSCSKFADVCYEKFVKGSRLVFVDFVF